MGADEVADVRRALARPAHDLTGVGVRRSAVAAILSPGRRLWFILRAERAGDPWSGHVGFPGGREHPEDPTLLDVALRETDEELGVDLSKATLLGRLDDVRTRPVRSLMVRPFVFALDHEPVVRPNHEVAGVVSVGLDELLEGHGRGRMRWPARVGLSLPRVDFAGVRLWGLTLVMVDDLLDRLDGRGKGLERPIGTASGD